jgi:hypothetical protein
LVYKKLSGKSGGFIFFFDADIGNENEMGSFLTDRTRKTESLPVFILSSRRA